MNGSNPKNDLDGWYRFFLILGLLGLIDITTRSLLHIGDSEFGLGIVTLGLTYVLKVVFPIDTLAIVITYTSLLLSFSILYLLIAWGIKTRIKKMSTEQKE